MVSSIECRSEISFYMKELTFFKSWVFIPNWAQQLECSIFFLFSNFSAPPTILNSFCERRIFFCSWADNFWRYVFIYPQYCTIFICAEKKHTHTVSDNFFLFVGGYFWRCVFIYPQYCTIFIRAEEKNRQTNKQHLRVDFPVKTEIIIKKKEIKSGGTQLEVK